MQSNLDVFLNAESTSTLWCSWTAPICNQTSKSAITDRLNKFIDLCAANGDRVWNIISNNDARLMSLKNSLSNVYIELEDSSRIIIFQPKSKVTFGRIERVENQILAFIGEENGSVHVLQIDSCGDVLLIAKCQSKLNSPVQFLLPQPNVSSLMTGSFHLWVYSDHHISLISGIPPPESSGTSVNVSTTCINLNTRVSFETQRVSEPATVLRVQLLDTASSGPSSLLAVHLLSAAYGAVQVYLVDASAAVDFASQVISGRSQARTEPVQLSAVVEIPFESAGSPVPTKSHGGISNMFSFNRPGTAQQEHAVASIIEQSTVRTVGRGAVRDEDAAHAGTQAPSVSFTVRIVGSNNTEIAATFSSARQRLLDALGELGSTVFSRADTELATTASAAAAGQALLGSQLLRTIFNSDGAIHSHKEIDMAPLVRDHVEADPELLWRAGLRLRVLPRWRVAAIQASISALDGVPDETSNSRKYFALSRMVLMEVALVGGLGHLVAQYIVARSEGCSDSGGDFLLADVKRVYEWAVGAASSFGSVRVESLQCSLESFVRASCKKDLVHSLLSTGSGRDRNSATDLQSALDITSGLRQVVEALLERKQHVLEGENSSDHVVVQVAEEGQLALRVHIQELVCLNQTIQVFMEIAQTAELNFFSLLPSEVHDLQRGHLHSSSSSSAAAASSMLSEYHFAVTNRVRADPELNFLPEYLRAGDVRLFDELCALLDQKSAETTFFLRVGGDSALGVNLDHLANSITSLLLVPLTALRAETARFLGTLPYSHRSPSHMDEAELSVSGKAQVGHSVVLYFLMEMLHQSVPALQSGLRANSLPVVKSLAKRVGAAAGLTYTVTNGVRALWQVDAGVAVADAVRLISSRDTSIAEDQNIIVTALRRMLASNHLAEAKALLSYLHSANHKIVQTKFFIMATAAAVPRPDLWQFSWHAAKALSAKQHGAASAEHVLVKRELVHMLMQWSLAHDEVGRLLDSVLDSEEQDEVELVLRGLAVTELDRQVLSSPAVDLCVAFLVRRARFNDAMEIHERQAVLATAACHQQHNSEALNKIFQAIDVRRTLIEAHASIPTITVANFHL